MKEKLNLSLNDFLVTFAISPKPNGSNSDIKFFINFFNRFPELIEDNSSTELNSLFWKLFPNSVHAFEIRDNASKFIHYINFIKFDSLPDTFRKIVKEESIHYIHSSARVILEFIFKISNKDMFSKVDSIIEKINKHFSISDSMSPWYDNIDKKAVHIDFEIGKISGTDDDDQYRDYFTAILHDNAESIYRSYDQISLEDDLCVQRLLAEYYFNSIPEDQNLLPYLLTRINHEHNFSDFEIHTFIPVDDEYSVNFVIHLSINDGEIVFNGQRNGFFNLILKALGAYLSKTERASNLFIRAINPSINMISYGKDLSRLENHLSEVYGFFFNEDFAYGLSKKETQGFLEKNPYILKYRHPKLGTFYSDAAEIYSHYATDKAISLILGDIKIYNK